MEYFDPKEEADFNRCVNMIGPQGVMLLLKLVHPTNGSLTVMVDSKVITALITTLRRWGYDKSHKAVRNRLQSHYTHFMTPKGIAQGKI